VVELASGLQANVSVLNEPFGSFEDGVAPDSPNIKRIPPTPALGLGFQGRKNPSFEG